MNCNRQGTYLKDFGGNTYNLPKVLKLLCIPMGSTGEATAQDMLAPDLLPLHPKLLRQVRINPCFRPVYFLLQLSNCVMGTCMPLAGLRVHEYW